MTPLSWVVLYGMAHGVIELGKAVVHVIRLVSFLATAGHVRTPQPTRGARTAGMCGARALRPLHSSSLISPRVLLKCHYLREALSKISHSPASFLAPVSACILFPLLALTTL